MSKVNLTIYASNPGVRDPDRLVLDRDEFEEVYRVRSSDGDYIGVLHTESQPVTPPKWQGFLQEGVDEDLSLASTYSSALLLIEVQDRLFALSFGYAYHKLNDAAIDQRFGLRATLNAIKPSSIRSIDRKIFDSVHRQAREQASVASEIEVFGINTNRDLLRAVTGRPDEDAPGSQMTGKDRLSLRVDCTVDDLPELLESLLELSERDTYRENYSWIDKIKEVRSRELRAELDVELARRIGERELDHIWLVPPNIIDWSETGGFKFRQAQSAGLFLDLLWEHYFEDRRPPGDFQPHHLDDDRVWRLDAEELIEIESYSLGRCVAAEIRYNDSLYVHSNRTWYEIDSDFAESVNQFIEDLDTTDVDLPPYRDSEEAIYNERVSEESEGYLCLMDRNNIRPSEDESHIEFCDLYSLNREMLHVKRYGGSSTLAVLFSQGQVSATTLFGHEGFRQNVVEELPDSHNNIPIDNINPRDFEVAFVVVTKPGKELSLPFFARVDLRETVRTLRPTGCRVTLTPVPNELEE